VIPAPALALAAALGAAPNVVLVFADDMGYSDTGPYGGEIRPHQRRHLVTHETPGDGESVTRERPTGGRRRLR
jgi:arylsulfatase A-like enzyme